MTITSSTGQHHRPIAGAVIATTSADAVSLQFYFAGATGFCLEWGRTFGIFPELYNNLCFGQAMASSTECPYVTDSDDDDCQVVSVSMNIRTDDPASMRALLGEMSDIANQFDTDRFG